MKTEIAQFMELPIITTFTDNRMYVHRQKPPTKDEYSVIIKLAGDNIHTWFVNNLGGSIKIDHEKKELIIDNASVWFDDLGYGELLSQLRKKGYILHVRNNAKVWMPEA